LSVECGVEFGDATHTSTNNLKSQRDAYLWKKYLTQRRKDFVFFFASFFAPLREGFSSEPQLKPPAAIRVVRGLLSNCRQPGQFSPEQGGPT